MRGLSSGARVRVVLLGPVPGLSAPELGVSGVIDSISPLYLLLYPLAAAGGPASQQASHQYQQGEYQGGSPGLLLAQGRGFVGVFVDRKG
jgi:hypothetical protein